MKERYFLENGKYSDEIEEVTFEVYECYLNEGGDVRIETHTVFENGVNQICHTKTVNYGY